MPGMNAKGAGFDIALALLAAQPLLRCGCLNALQQIRNHRPPATTRQGAREQGGLIIAPLQETPAMQRHRRDEIAVGQELGAGVLQHSSKGPGDIRAIGMLETKNHAARAIVVAKGGARARERRRLHRAGAANRHFRDRPRQRIAAKATQRRPEKGEMPPAIRTKAARPLDDHSASKTTRRQQRVQAPKGRTLQRLSQFHDNPPGKSTSGLIT